MNIENRTNLKPLPRPYTAYNIFFQLEREYILQHDLNVTPKLCAEDVFDCCDQNYEGPALPSRYQGIILRNDWHVPGKAQRNKRQHRASHRRISFIDLSKKVSSSWHSCEKEVKLFCAHISDIGMMKYKRETHNYKKKKNVTKKKRLPKRQIPQMTSKPKNDNLPKAEPCSTLHTSMFCQEVCTYIASSKTTLLDPLVELPSSHANLSPKSDINKEPSKTYIFCPEAIGSDNTACTTMPLRISSHIAAKSFLVPDEIPSSPVSKEYGGFCTSRSSTAFGDVDMHDDEIFNIWRSLGRRRSLQEPKDKPNEKTRNSQDKPGQKIPFEPRAHEEKKLDEFDDTVESNPFSIPLFAAAFESEFIDGEVDNTRRSSRMRKHSYVDNLRFSFELDGPE